MNFICGCRGIKCLTSDLNESLEEAKKVANREGFCCLVEGYNTKEEKWLYEVSELV